MKDRGLIADLHIHSTISDGPLSADEIFAQARLSGVGLVSVTDHDTVRGQSGYKRKAAEKGLAYINGIEISAYDKDEDVQVHILGYGFYNDSLLESFCAGVSGRRREAGFKMAERIIDMGYPLSIEEILGYAKGGIIYRPHILHALYARGHIKTLYDGHYAEWFGKGGPAYFPFEYADPREAVEAVRQAGGLAVLAHPAGYRNWGCIPGLVAAGLDGLESHHPSHRAEDIMALLEAARANRLITTSGSDFHGMYSRNPWPIGFGCVRARNAITEFAGQTAGEGGGYSDAV